MSRQVEVVVDYLKYTFKAQSKYQIHSPFVFDFYDKVMQNGQHHPQYRVVNWLRKEIESGSRFIKRKDLDADSHGFPCDQRFVRVKDLVHHSSVSKKKGELLFRLARHFKPMTILELGTSIGISTIYLSLAVPESRIITIDGCIDSTNVARENFEKAGIKNIQVITGNFDQKLAVALAEMPVPDLVFIDGNHKKEPTLSYFEQCLPHFHPGTILIIDDIHWSAGMTEAWNTIRNHPEVKVSIDIFHMGILFFKEELSKENFILHFKN